MEAEAVSTEQGSEERQGKEASLQQEITCSTAIHVLDSLTMKIRAAENKLIQQRVDAAVLTVELATLHDPHMRELLALCNQEYLRLSKKIDNYKNLLDQFSQEIKSSLPQGAESNLSDSSIPIPLDVPSSPLLGSQT